MHKQISTHTHCMSTTILTARNTLFQMSFTNSLRLTVRATAVTPPEHPPSPASPDTDPAAVVGAVMSAAEVAGVDLTLAEVELLVNNMAAAGSDMPDLLRSAQRVVDALAAEGRAAAPTPLPSPPPEAPPQPPVDAAAVGVVLLAAQAAGLDLAPHEVEKLVGRMGSPEAVRGLVEAAAKVLTEGPATGVGNAQQRSPSIAPPLEAILPPSVQPEGSLTDDMVALVEAAMEAGMPREMVEMLPSMVAGQQAEELRAMTATLRKMQGASTGAVFVVVGCLRGCWHTAVDLPAVGVQTMLCFWC